jgi:hypothetical protein
VGVIVSPRDLSFDKAKEYSPHYKQLGASVLVDQQFYVPDSSVGKLETYPISGFRDSVSKLHQVSDQQLTELAETLKAINRDLAADGVIAPAVVYEAGRPDIIELNERLFDVAKSVGDDLGVPTYGTVVLGRSVTASDATMSPTLSAATALDPDGWYFGFEFEEARVPSSHALVLRCCRAGLTLACTGKPVLHAYAGPMALLSFGFGATGVGVGHSQNLWQFTRQRWHPAESAGGGGDAPPRFFSRALWGTFVYEDELALLPRELREQVLTTTPFSAGLSPNPPYLPWSRWDANKHLVNLICTTVSELADSKDAQNNTKSAIDTLTNAIDLHSRIRGEGISLTDATNSYQRPWRAALESLLAGHGDDFDYLQLLSEL